MFFRKKDINWYFIPLNIDREVTEKHAVEKENGQM